MLFDRVKLECFQTVGKDKKVKYGFKLMKNRQVTKIYTQDADIYEKFKRELSLRCILNTFQENYHIEKLIGTGAFGKVRELFYSQTIKNNRYTLLDKNQVLKCLQQRCFSKIQF